MKKLIISSLTVLVLAACGDGKTEVEKSKHAIDMYYSEPALKEYYGEDVVNAWHKTYEAIQDDENMLKSHQEFILDKLANAQAELEIKKLTEAH